MGNYCCKKKVRVTNLVMTKKRIFKKLLWLRGIMRLKIRITCRVNILVLVKVLPKSNSKVP